ncbi:MAG: hypothetical protein EAZ42_00325 [Verrucomicrobia bacterium]|nr:MAG: hypothetical protein EAZ42_00325 [Verrucomicrobiota bacterium]
MKWILIFYSALLIPILADSAVKPPRDAFFSGKFAEAQAAAIKQGKAIAFIETDSASSCSKTHSGASLAYSALKSDFILVIRDRALEQCPKVDEMSSAIQETIKIGNTSPRITIVEPKELKFITGADYRVITNEKNWDRDAKEKAEAAMKGAAATPAAVETMQDWTNIEGKTIRAILVEKKPESVVLKLESDRIVEYPIDKLSAETKALLEKK